MQSPARGKARGQGRKRRRSQRGGAVCQGFTNGAGICWAEQLESTALSGGTRLGSQPNVQVPDTMRKDRLTYMQAWRSLKRRRLTTAVLFLGYLPGVALIAVSAREVESVAKTTALIWIGLFGAATGWLSLFRCPRCNKLFASSWTLQNPFTRRCLHCGLPVGAQAEG